jgi:hypothetical protein
VAKTRVLLASAALFSFYLSTTPLDARGGGGGHAGEGGRFGGESFGGARIGETHVGASSMGAVHFGGTHIGGAHVRGAPVGVAGVGAHVGSVGGVDRAHLGYGHLGVAALGHLHSIAAFGSRGFHYNAFAARDVWNRWHARHWDGRHWAGWVGPVFWPYIYGDVFSYALWPGLSDDSFWSDGDAYFWSGLYSARPYSAEALGGQYDGLYDVYGGSTASNEEAQQGPNSLPDTMSCSDLAPGVTDLPFERIRQVIRPTASQATVLKQLQSATSSARAVIARSCPAEVPLTPLNRLDAVERRLEGMLSGVQIVRVPLETFYRSLSEGQKQQLSALGGPATSSAMTLCDPQVANFAQLPVDRIERSVQPTREQEPVFQALKTASINAANALQASCPTYPLQDPSDRMDAVQARLRALVQAAETVRPALAAFYGSLSDEQKARLTTSSYVAAAP